MIAAEHASYPVALMCRCLNVSRSGFYAWKQSTPSSREVRDVQLTRSITEIHARSRQTYGSPRVWHELRARGEVVGHKRVERLMRQNGIMARHPRPRCVTTVRDDRNPTAENLLNRDFTAAKPNQVWVGDITYIPTGEGWLYLAVLIDVFSRRVVGWSMADHMRTGLPKKALEMALGTRDVPPELMHHSDRGCQYTSGEYQSVLRRAGVTASMSRPGNCHDNALAESFNGTLKTELFYDLPMPATRARARVLIEDYLELFYNRERRHSAIDFMSPADFEARHLQQAAMVAA